MKKLIITSIVTVLISLTVYSQNELISPKNNPFDVNLIKEGNSKMAWYMLKDTLMIELGKVNTEIQKKEDELIIITSINIAQATTKWIDTTIAEINTLKPIYHSSFNEQRDMVLKYGEEIRGYYLDKKTNKKTPISEKTTKPYFDSNIYPQLIRWLPLKDNYTETISIFDYNPSSKTGVITATVQNALKDSMILNGKEWEIYKVTVTDDISDNKVVSTYYIERKSRKILKQEIDIQGQKMIMELDN